MSFFCKIVSALKKPLEQYFYYFLFVFILTAIPDLIFGIYVKAIPVRHVICGFFISYVVTLGYSCLAKYKYPGRIYSSVVFAVILAFFQCDLFSMFVCNNFFKEDMIAALVGTNYEEAVEFVSTYFSWKVILFAVLFLVLVAVLYFALKRLFPHVSKFVVYAGIGLSLLSCPVCFVSPLFQVGIVGKICSFFVVSTPPNFADYYSNPDLTIDENKHPENVVMIIGESLSKYHCSLYGYDKETNPVLTEKRDSCGLLVYKNVESPETSTLVSIREVVSTFDHTKHPEDNWFTHVTLQEVLRLSGYKSFWISNQSKKGFRDNYVGRYSDLCDENYFVGNKFMGMARLNTDDQLLDLMKPVMEDSAGHKFYFVHMMGNHTTFSKRYTPDFSVFKAADYANLPEHQRQIISEYDNSVLFNDNVVGSIMDLYKDKEAIVFYFPDHALDLYQTTSTYFGHARG